LQDRDKFGRYRPGFNPRISKRLRVEARLRELVAEYFPNGGCSVIDANRVRVRAAQAALNVETPRLEPQRAPLNLVAEEIEPLAVVVERQRRRADAMLREARDIEVLPSGIVTVLPKPGSNGSNDEC